MFDFPDIMKYHKTEENPKYVCRGERIDYIKKKLYKQLKIRYYFKNVLLTSTLNYAVFLIHALG